MRPGTKKRKDLKELLCIKLNKRADQGTRVNSSAGTRLDYSSIFPTDDRPTINYCTPLLETMLRNTFWDKVYVNPVRITLFQHLESTRNIHFL